MRFVRTTPRAAFVVTNMGVFNLLTRLFKREPGAPTELDEAVLSFQRTTGVSFKDPRLLRVALTHGSYVHEHPDTGLESMGRMELLGDSVLGLVVNEYLYASFPEEEEGELTKMKSLLVSKAVLARRGRNMRLGHFLLLGEGEVDAGGRDRTSIVADGYESVIGAIYLDQGLEGARQFISRTLLEEARRILADSKHINYKSVLQEHVQGEMRVHPEYRVLSEVGPEHEKQFTIEVSVRRKVLGRGSGKSKKEAEQAAARQALSALEHPIVNNGYGPRRVSRERRFGGEKRRDQGPRTNGSRDSEAGQEPRPALARPERPVVDQRDRRPSRGPRRRRRRRGPGFKPRPTENGAGPRGDGTEPER